MTKKLSTNVMLVDLYELTMAQCYFYENMFADAVFSLFVRKYPKDRGYLVSAGLADVIDFLGKMAYTQDDLDYLHTTGLFTKDFLHFLSSVKFNGNVHAMPEGRIFFKDEPVIEVTAPIIQGQLVETAIINRYNFQVNLATKISRCVTAAQGRTIVDFSLRRTQGPSAGMEVARSGWIAGMGATSNILAGQTYGMPVSGTMAHSFVTAFKDELSAFRAYARLYGDETVLLIDTYDTLNGASKAIQVAEEMEAQGKHLKAVRLDSGDMIELSRSVRQMFDKAGFESVKIFASGGFDEYEIERYLKEGAKIDAFGVGTRMGVSADAPYTDMAYKLVAYDRQPVLKLSSGKKTLVSAKQVFRQTEGGMMVKDTIAARNESPSGTALLKPVIENGCPVGPREELTVSRDRFQSDLAQLDKKYQTLRSPEEYPVDISDTLHQLQEAAVKRVTVTELGKAGSRT